MKKSQRFLALVLSLVLILALAVPASADYDYKAHAKIFYNDYTGKTVILHSNDVHGYIDGYACMAAARTTFENAGANVLVVDAGDFSQGTSYVSSSKGASAVTMMNAAGYDIVTLGNHEFDYSYEQLMENLKDATFQVICADIYVEQTGETLFPATTVVEIPSAKTGSTDAGSGDADGKQTDSLRLGFFGMDTPECATKANPAMTRGLSFAMLDDFSGSAQLAVDSLKEEGVDLIIGLVHLGVDKETIANGYSSIDLYDKVTDIDFLIDGHSHTVMTAGENGEPIQSTGCYSANIGVIVIDNETKTIEDHFLLAIPGLPKDADVAAAAKRIMDAVNKEYNTPFARTEVYLNGERTPNRTVETNLGQLVTDAMLWAVVSSGGLEEMEEFADAPVLGINNGGSFRAPIEIGDVTKNDVNMVLPFGNTVYVIYVTGAELLEVLEASSYCTPEAIGGFPQTSGIEWVLDTTKAYDKGDLYILDGRETTYYEPASIQRVTIKTVDGKPFDENATYAVITNDFCASGGDTYNAFHRAFEQGHGFDTGIPMDEAFTAYINDVMNGVIGEQYASPRAEATQILP